MQLRPATARKAHIASISSSNIRFSEVGNPCGNRVASDSLGRYRLAMVKPLSEIDTKEWSQMNTEQRKVAIATHLRTLVKRFAEGEDDLLIKGALLGAIKNARQWLDDEGL